MFHGGPDNWVVFNEIQLVKADAHRMNERIRSLEQAALRSNLDARTKLFVWSSIAATTVASLLFLIIFFTPVLNAMVDQAVDRKISSQLSQ